MPIYQYEDIRFRCDRIVELQRTVAERDSVPAHLKRITVPVRIGIAGTSSTPIDPTSADAAVPRAYRQLEQKMGHREILKESGFSTGQVKEAWNM
jgi:hypothetical protein